MVKKSEIKSIELVLPEAEWAARLYECGLNEEKLGDDLRAYQEWVRENPDNFDKLEACIEVLALGKDLENRLDVIALLGDEVQAGPGDGFRRRPTGLLKKAPWIYGAVAACFSLVAFFFLLDSPPDYQAHYQTGIGEQAVYTLPDGSRVHMNTDTRLVLDYMAGYRKLHLMRGEASFDVAHDAARPFDVMSGKGRIRALGTRFNVYNKGGKVTISVLEGVVQVASAPMRDALPEANGPKLVMGQQMNYDEKGEMSEVRAVDIDRIQAWQQGRLEFLNTPLTDVVREMNRYSPMLIIIGDDTLRALRVSGIFDVRETADMLGGLEDILPVKLLQDNQKYIIVKRDKRESSL